MRLHPIAAALLVAVVGSPAIAGDLHVRITGATPGQCSLIVCLWRDASGFPDCVKHRPLDKKMAAGAAEVLVTFGHLAPGRYAVSAFDDANGNGRLDTNFIGIPKEKLGMSNDPEFHLGAPPFSAAVFNFGQELTISIAMRSIRSASTAASSRRLFGSSSDCGPTFLNYVLKAS